MGKKKSKNPQPNAPELQQILLSSNIQRQPPHNPYYPDLETTSALLPPPPYSDLSITNNSAMPANYPRTSQHVGQSPAAVIIQQPHYVDRKAERYHRNVRKFNNQMLIASMLVIAMAIYAESLYKSRPCVLNYVVHAPCKDFSVNIELVQKMHLYVAYGSVVALLICLAKSSSGQSSSYSCYLLMISLTAFIGTVVTGYLVYLAFYSPCSVRLNELIANTLKTFVSKVVDSMPAPDKKVFGESNVFELAKEDPNGVWIFLIDVFNFALYLSALISATTLC